MGIYADLGVKTYINAMGTLSKVGGSRMLQPTLDAMAEASLDFVEIAEVRRILGEDIARATKNEAAYIASSASSLIIYGVAACMVGGANERLLKRLPITEGLKTEVVVLTHQRTPYDFAVKVAGAVVVEAGDKKSVTAAQLDAAIGKNTAAVFYSERPSQNILPVELVCEIAHKKGVPVIVDAAAVLPPASNLWHYTNTLGADLVLFSGGKDLKGPQQSGLAVGKKWIIDAFPMIAAPHHGIGRSYKMGREEIVGLYTAVMTYLSEGNEEKHLQRMRDFAERSGKAFAESGLFNYEIDYPNGEGANIPGCLFTLKNPGAFTNEELQDACKEKGVLIGMAHQKKGNYIWPADLTEEELPTVIETVISCAKALLGGK